MAAVVQADAADELPEGIELLLRPVGSGAVRAARGLLPVGPAAVIHGLDVDLPLLPTAPTVTTVHDLSVFDVPWAFPRHRVLGERRLLARAVASADAVIAVSAFTADRIKHHFGRTARVVPLAPSPQCPTSTPEQVVALRRRFGLPPRFVLHVGTIEPRKDGRALAAACKRLQVPLVMAGGTGCGDPVPPGVRHLGYVDAADLPVLYDAAEIVAYISRYEGFGLPPIEAMARARPVVTTAVGALPDVVQDGAALIGLGDDETLVSTIGALWRDDEARLHLATRGQEVASALTWTAAATDTLAVYESLGVDL